MECSPIVHNAPKISATVIFLISAQGPERALVKLVYPVRVLPPVAVFVHVMRYARENPPISALSAQPHDQLDLFGRPRNTDRPLALSFGPVLNAEIERAPDL